MEKTEKINYLDGIRAISAIIVVFHHYILAFLPALYTGNAAESHINAASEAYLAGSPLGIFYAGNFAVCLFYILSGFVLSYKFLKFKNYEIIISSAIRRYFRLVVPILVSVFVAYILMKLGFFFNKEASEFSKSSWWFAGQWSFETSFWHMLKSGLFRVFFAYDASYNTALWMMSYIFYGSFITLGVIALFGKLKLRYVAYVLTYLILINTYYSAFILGIILADIFANSPNFFKKFNHFYITIPLILIGIFFGAYPFGVYTNGTIYELFNLQFLPSPGQFWHIIGSFLIIIAAFASTNFQKFLSNKFLIFTGAISFSIYLIHALVLGSLSSWIFLKLIPHFSYVTSFSISFIVSIPIIFILAFYSTKHIDSNGLKFSQYIYEKLAKPTLLKFKIIRTKESQ
ncbi:MAG: hypothetical protein UT33_C0005G0021 [Candidatus Peregrinibacteria bacterium GW2011_GWC2_39_14]|nr:MAG: hypothetical protein US92_C0001G0021 [Candidatus Peregrinibacteria bacterium GW2011_GWA2_38_36]KKR07077.1 MAG: hypothetical protein UT33_C0005G0021 [Candidatus Peregrinibacteria bacterium GW2011_GWC2_39_14]